MPAAQHDSRLAELTAHIRRAVAANAPTVVINQVVCVAAGEFTARQHLYVTETPSTEHTCLASGVVVMEGLAMGQNKSSSTGRAGYCNEQEAAAAGRLLVESTSAKSQVETVAAHARQDSWKVTATFSSPQAARAFFAEAAYSSVRLHVQGPGGTSVRGLPELRGRAPPMPRSAEAQRARSLRVDFQSSAEALPPTMAATIVRTALSQIIPPEKQLAEEGLTDALRIRIVTASRGRPLLEPSRLMGLYSKAPALCD
jgi:hypothetical protein